MNRKDQALPCFMEREVRMKRFILFFLSLLLGFIFQGNSQARSIIEIKSAGEYTLGDNDSKTDARKIALEYAKRKALEEVGILIVSETKVINGVVSRDQIETYSSSVMETDIISEDMQLLENKTTIYKINILARIDKDLLFQRIDEAKKNKGKEKMIAELQVENKRLYEQLIILNDEIKKKTNDSRIRLLEKRDVVFSDLDKNQNSIRRVFKEGDLIELAMKSNQEEEAARKDIEINFWDFIKRKTQINIKSPQIKHKKQNGDETSTIIIDVDYQMDKASLINVLEKYINVYQPKRNTYPYNAYKNFIAMYRDRNEYTGQKKPYSASLKRYIASKNISLELTLGNYKLKNVIAAPSKSEALRSNKYVGDIAIWRKFSIGDISYREGSGSGPDQGYILITGCNCKYIFEDIPIAALKSIGNIEANIIFEDNNFKFGR